MQGRVKNALTCFCIQDEIQKRKHCSQKPSPLCFQKCTYKSVTWESTGDSTLVKLKFVPILGACSYPVINWTLSNKFVISCLVKLLFLFQHIVQKSCPLGSFPGFSGLVIITRGHGVTLSHSLIWMSAWFISSCSTWTGTESNSPHSFSRGQPSAWHIQQGCCDVSGNSRKHLGRNGPGKYGNECQQFLAAINLPLESLSSSLLLTWAPQVDVPQAPHIPVS